MAYDLIIKNGRILDPSRKLDRTGDIYVADGRIVEPGTGGEAAQSIDASHAAGATHVIDAAGYIVTPGLVDFHTHIYYGGTEAGAPPDLAFIPNGVTTAVDGGSSGYTNYEAFRSSVAASSQVTIKSFINVSPVGQPTSKYDECIDPPVL